ncbi:MAG: CUB domain-containing protein [Chitinophagales bacterium]
MKTYFTFVLCFIGFCGLGFGQNGKSDTTKQQKNFVKINGVIKPIQSDTVKTKEYYLQEQGNSFLMTFPENTSITSQNFFEKTKDLFIKDNDNEIRIVNTETDNNGITHYSYAQYYKGIKVLGGYVKIHVNETGKINSVSGRQIMGLNLESNPNISLDEAKQIAIQDIKKEITEAMLSEIEFQISVGEIIFTPISGQNRNNEYTLGYKFDISTNKNLLSYSYIIDAYDAHIIRKYSNNHDAVATGTGNSIYSGSVEFTNEFNGIDFTLQDLSRNIFTYNIKYADGLDTEEAENFHDSDNIWDKKVAQIGSVTINSINPLWIDIDDFSDSLDLYLKIFDNEGNFLFQTQPEGVDEFPFVSKGLSVVEFPFVIEIWDEDSLTSDDKVGGFYISDTNEINDYSDGESHIVIYKHIYNDPAVDVHWGMQKVYDFYKNRFGRISYDSAGSAIKSYLYFDPFFDPGLYTNNAFASSSKELMVFGLGNGLCFKPVVSLDVSGHEYTHLVIHHTSNLSYSAESGALNESFADIMGTAIDFYTDSIDINYNVANWDLGEVLYDACGNYFRSMSNPNLKNDPDTYLGDYWYSGPSNMTFVHTNSGVQNYWYYLLCEGGAGTNDRLNEYSVTPIGMDKATEIAYYNMTTYLYGLPEASYYDAALGSLSYIIDSESEGSNSAVWNSVVNAWYAVGVLDNPAQYCAGLSVLTDSEGEITDGSNENLYGNNLHCSWLISPPGATSITLNFSEFFTEFGHDSVVVYDGNNEFDPVLLSWSGHDMLPPEITSSGGEMLIVFNSDGDNNDYGWTAYYTSTSESVGCSGSTVLTDNSGYFSDGSGVEDYTNNNNCTWLISPISATSITLNFSSFNTEEGYDFVNVYDGYNNSAPLINSFSGTTIPSTIISTGGALYIEFFSDGATTAPGWSANYTSDGIIPTTSSMSSYEYWFDDNYIEKTSGILSGTNTNFNESIDVSSLNNGLHSFHIRFKDANGLWSSVLSQFFVKTPITIAGNNITNAEYWYDDDYADKTEITGINDTHYNFLNSIYVGSLNNGLHSLHIRFKDANNLWSSVLSQFFIKVPQIDVPNKVATYQFWFDDEDYADVNSIVLPTPINPYEIDDVVDVTALSGGEHRIHFRFQDINGLWSSIVTDTFAIEINTIAEFIVLDTTVCLGNAVAFDNLSQNATTFQWNFGDGTTSSSFEPVHTYSLPGIYSITLKAKNNSTGVIDVYTLTNAVNIIETPTISISALGPTNFCKGESVILTAEYSEGSIQWKMNGANIPGATSITYNASKKANYTCVATNSCGATLSNTIFVNVYKQPVANITAGGPTTFCPGGNVTLSAATAGGQTYQWYKGNTLISGATSSSYVATIGGNYKCKVTKAATGCYKFSNIIPVSVSCKTANFDDLSLKIFPNPNGGDFQLVFNSTCEGKVHIFIYNSIGELIIKDQGEMEDMMFAKNYTITKNAQGCYLVKVVCDEISMSEIIIINR